MWADGFGVTALVAATGKTKPLVGMTLLGTQRPRFAAGRPGRQKPPHAAKFARAVAMTPHEKPPAAAAIGSPTGGVSGQRTGSSQ